MKIYEPQITGSLGINGSTIGNFNNLVSTSSFNQYTSSISTGSLATTGSNTFIGNQNISGTVYLTGSIIPTITNTYDLGDSTHQFRHLYLSSGSLYINGTKVIGATGQELQITTDNGQSFKILEVGSDTITLQSADGNITLTTSGDGDVILHPSSGIVALKGTTTLYSGYKIVSSDGNAIQFGDDLGVTGSINTTGNINGVNITSFSSSVASQMNSLQINTGSTNTRLNVIESKYATTGSNIFIGTQTFTGSVYITNDLIVQGSSSLQNITASAVSIGTNTIILNTATPAIRYAGITIFDSGSSGVSASLLWDSQTDDFIFTHKSSGSNVLDSSMFIYGPLNTGSLDSIAGITSNRLTKGESGNDHGHHITASQISDDGINVSIPNNLEVTGSIKGSSISGQILSTNGVVSGSSQIIGILNSLNTYTGSNDTTNTTQNNRLSSIETVTSSLSTTYEGRASTSKTIFSGSSQVTISSTTGYSSVINQAVLTTSSPTFASVTTNGSINVNGGNATTYISGGVGALPAAVFTSTGNSWSEGIWINPAPNNYAGVYFLTAANTPGDGMWFAGKVSNAVSGWEHAYGIFRRGYTSPIGGGTATFAIKQDGTAYFNENVINTKSYKANTFVQLTSVATKTFSWTGSPGGNFAVTDFSGVPSNAKALAVYGWYHIRGYASAQGQGDHAVSWFGLTNGTGPISWSDPNGGYPGGSDTFTPQYYGSFVMEHDGDASIASGASAGMHYYGSWHQGIINVNANGNIYYTLGYGYSGGTHYNALYCTGYWV